MVAVASIGTIGWRVFSGGIASQLGLLIPLVLLALSAIVTVYAKGAMATTVTVDAAGMLRVDLGDNAHSFDLASEATRLEMVGPPGREGLARRPAAPRLDPVPIDARVVEPAEFTDTIRQWRPDI